jgi:hypothetical protein
MKDAKGHGSNSRGVAPAPVDVKLPGEQPFGIKSGPNRGRDTPAPLTKSVNQSIVESGGKPVASNSEAARNFVRALAKTMQPPAVHDSMARSPGQSDRSYIGQRLTANAEKSVGTERRRGESNASYIRRRISE